MPNSNAKFDVFNKAVQAMIKSIEHLTHFYCWRNSARLLFGLYLQLKNFVRQVLDVFIVKGLRTPARQPPSRGDNHLTHLCKTADEANISPWLLCKLT